MSTRGAPAGATPAPPSSATERLDEPRGGGGHADRGELRLLLALWRRLWRSGWTAGLAVVAIAALFRGYLLTTVFAHIDADQAVLGLMALHVQAGDRPVFYYGQPYMGSLEAYMAAVAFHLWGAGEWTVRLPALAFSVLFVAAVYWLGVSVYGRWIGFLAGLFVALGPAILINWSTAAGAGYIEAMVCGTALFALAVRYPDLRVMPLWAALATGLLCGLGIWMEPMIVEYLVPLAVAFVLRLLLGLRERPAARWLGLARSLGAIAAGTAVGAAPFLLYNLRHNWETLSYLSARSAGGNHLAVAQRVVTETMPILLGLITPTTVASVFAQLVAGHPLPYLVGLVAGAAIVARLVFDPRGLPLRMLGLVRPLDGRPLRHPARSSSPGADPVARPWDAGDGMLALFVVVCAVSFVFSGFGAVPWATRLPRYLIPLYTATPLVLDCFIPRRPRWPDRWIATVAVGTLLLVGVLTTLSIEPRPSIDAITGLLEARGVRMAYADYWLAARIAFDTRERVKSIAVDDALGLGENRMLRYFGDAARTPAGELAWAFQAGSMGEQRFRVLLHLRHTRASRVVGGGGLDIYTSLSRPLRAPAELNWAAPR